jgi:sarcosine oxidase delta subunit
MATAKEYADWIVKNADKQGTPEFETVSRAYSAARAKAQTAADDKRFAFDPERDMSTSERFFSGVGKAMTDLGRGAGQLVGAVSRQDVADARKLDAPLMNTTAGKVGDVVGNVAMMAPTAMIPGAATIRGGALVGSIAGLLQPSTSTQETLTNVGMGGVAGAAVPAAVAGYRTARAAAEPFYEGGRNAIVGRAMNRAAGADAPAVAQRLREASTPFVGPQTGPVQRQVMGELVPGSMPTVGQAAQNPGIAALERAATASNPEVTNAVSQVMQNQNTARVGVLEEMAGRASGARDFFGAARDATANQLYGNARANGMQPLTQQQQAIVGDLMQRPAIRGGHMNPGALDVARRLAANEGLNLTDPAGSVAGLDYVRRALADQVQGATGNERRILTDLLTRLTGVIDQVSPDLRVARETFAGMSRPLNQMDVAQDLVQRSVNPLSGNLQPAAYARNLNNAAAARATGMAGATREGTMSNHQLNQLAGILQDVQRANAAQTVGRGVGSDTVQKLAYLNILDEAGVPTAIRNFGPAQIVGGVGGRVADAAYARANRELANRLAEVMLDPQQAAQLMLLGAPRQPNAMVNMLTRSGSGAMLAAPAAANP